LQCGNRTITYSSWTGSPLARNHVLLAGWSLGYRGILWLIAVILFATCALFAIALISRRA
jgi:hypothetical protein